MKSKYRRKDRRRPKVTMYQDGTVTLSGLGCRDARWILDMARLYRYEHEFKPEPEEGPMADVIRMNNACSIFTERWIIWCLENLSNGIKKAIEEDNRKHGATWMLPKPLKEALQERAKEREIINRVTEIALKEIRARKAVLESSNETTNLQA